MRILLDTNIWISAFLSPEGHCGRLVRRLLGDGGVEIVTSAAEGEGVGADTRVEGDR